MRKEGINLARVRIYGDTLSDNSDIPKFQVCKDCRWRYRERPYDICNCQVYEDGDEDKPGSLFWGGDCPYKVKGQ